MPVLLDVPVLVPDDTGVVVPLDVGVLVVVLDDAAVTGSAALIWVTMLFMSSATAWTAGSRSTRSKESPPSFRRSRS